MLSLHCTKLAGVNLKFTLKDQSALDDYLVQQGIEGAVLKVGSNADIAGQDLARIVDEARQLDRVLEAFPTQYPRHILEQAAIAGAFVPGAVDKDLQGTADSIADKIEPYCFRI